MVLVDQCLMGRDDYLDGLVHSVFIRWLDNFFFWVTNDEMSAENLNPFGTVGTQVSLLHIVLKIDVSPHAPQSRRFSS